MLLLRTPPTYAGVPNGNGHGTDGATSVSGTEASPLKDSAKVLFDPKAATATNERADDNGAKGATIGVEQATKANDLASLNAVGAPSNMRPELVFGPEQYLGINHGALYHTQAAKHIQALMDYGNEGSITGNQIRALIEGHNTSTSQYQYRMNAHL